MADYPISATCPVCGRSDHVGVPPDRTIAFQYDRVCSACGTRYTPPTPTWASALFLLVGLLMAAFGLLALTGILERLEPSGEDSIGLRLRSLVPLAVGLMFAAYGWRSLSQRALRTPPRQIPAGSFAKIDKAAIVATPPARHSIFGLAATICALSSLGCTIAQLAPFRRGDAPLKFGDPLSLAALILAVIAIKLALKCLSEQNVRSAFQWVGLGGSVLALIGCVAVTSLS